MIAKIYYLPLRFNGILILINRFLLIINIKINYIFISITIIIISNPDNYTFIIFLLIYQITTPIIINKYLIGNNRNQY